MEAQDAQGEYFGVPVHFSDFFAVPPELIEDYGAFNISLVNDLPVFIDPFLIFNSENEKYQQLHNGIIQYLKFLRDKSTGGNVPDGLLRAWYFFSEVKQNWLGYSLFGNRGTGLGRHFATALNKNLHTIFSNFGNENVTRGSHLEKLCLIQDGVGRDNISDFTTNLIKEFLLEYTQNFAQQYINPDLRKVFVVERVRFNYHTETWERGKYELPEWNGDFVILTPKNILTQDEIWISKSDMISNFSMIAQAIPNEQLREQINNYFSSILADDPSKSEIEEATIRAIQQYPQLIEYYIRYKEDRGDEARDISREKISRAETVFIEQLGDFIKGLDSQTGFYGPWNATYSETRKRVLFLKDMIENKDGYRFFYEKGQPIKREKDIQLLFRLTWCASPLDVSPETNDGRGPVDYKISYGSKDITLVEFKLASNTQLKRNLKNQVDVYKQAHNTDWAFKVILYFSQSEFDKVNRILKELDLEDDQDIVLIDARNDNKPSASRA